MRFRWLLALPLAAVCWGQATPPPVAGTPPAANPAPAAESVAPDDPVITIDGICEQPSGAANTSACKLIITRAQFEAVINAIQPTMPPPARRQFATSYANALSMAEQARKMGLDSGPKFDLMMKLQRLTVLVRLLQESLQQQASQIPEKDIADYYQANAKNYEEVELQRIFVPKAKQFEPPKAATEEEKKKLTADSEAAMKAEADALQKLAAGGEDFSKLQAQAYQFAGMKNAAPNSNLGKVRPNSLSPTHAAVAMALKPGEVSMVISDPTGYFIYKAGAGDTIPLARVHDEIFNSLRAQRLSGSLQAAQKATAATYNDAYFAQQPPRPTLGMPAPAGNGGTPPPTGSK